LIGVLEKSIGSKERMIRQESEDEQLIRQSLVNARAKRLLLEQRQGPSTQP
jgi:hypothetical protein